MVRSTLIVSVTFVVLLGATTTQADSPPVANGGGSVKPVPKLFKGRPHEEWVAEFQSELNPGQRIESLNALVCFGSNGKAPEVVSILLELFDGYPPEAPQFVGAWTRVDGTEMEKLFNGPSLHRDLQPYFQNFDDLQLFIAASNGFYRLAPRAVPVLTAVLEGSEDRATARMASFMVLLRRQHPALAELMPKLVAQKQDQLGEIVFLLWEDGGDNGPSREIFEAAAPGLLALKEQRHVLRAIKAITKSAHPLRPEVAAPLLKQLIDTTTDDVIKQAASNALQGLQLPSEVKQEAK